MADNLSEEAISSGLSYENIPLAKETQINREIVSVVNEALDSGRHSAARSTIASRLTDVAIESGHNTSHSAPSPITPQSPENKLNQHHGYVVAMIPTSPVSTNNSPDLVSVTPIAAIAVDDALASGITSATQSRAASAMADEAVLAAQITKATPEIILSPDVTATVDTALDAGLRSADGSRAASVMTANALQNATTVTSSPEPTQSKQDQREETLSPQSAITPVAADAIDAALNAGLESANGSRVASAMAADTLEIVTKSAETNISPQPPITPVAADAVKAALDAGIRSADGSRAASAMTADALQIASNQRDTPSPEVDTVTTETPEIILTEPTQLSMTPVTTDTVATALDDGMKSANDSRVASVMVSEAIATSADAVTLNQTSSRSSPSPRPVSVVSSAARVTPTIDLTVNAAMEDGINSAQVSRVASAMTRDAIPSVASEVSIKLDELPDETNTSQSQSPTLMRSFNTITLLTYRDNSLGQKHSHQQ